MCKRILSVVCLCILCFVAMFLPPIHYPGESDSRAAALIINETLSPDKASGSAASESAAKATDAVPLQQTPTQSNPTVTLKDKPTELKDNVKNQPGNAADPSLSISTEKSGSETKKTPDSSQIASSSEPTAVIPAARHSLTTFSPETSTITPAAAPSPSAVSPEPSPASSVSDPLQIDSNYNSVPPSGILSTDNRQVQANAAFIFENNPILFSNPVYIINCRYYLPLTDMLGALGGNLAHMADGNILRVSLHQKEVEISGNSFSSGQDTLRLFCGINSINDVIYISLIDMVRMFDWVTDWDVPDETVYIFKNRSVIERKTQKKGEKTALIRLEDFSAGENYRHSPEDLVKIRITVDYLESCGIPYYVAWVPRYMDPANNIDMDPLSNFSTYNICFIYTLDYMVWHSGYIGLHGYTHQHGIEQSLLGNESGSGINDKPGQMRKRIEMAINTANKLGIHYTFFEFPHYAATNEQLEIAEEYFDYIYEPRPGTHHVNVLEIKKPGRSVKYIPTPLDYINSKYDVDKMLEKISSLKPDTLASFFFHPVLEYESIELTKESDGYPTHKYDTGSILHRVVEHLEKNGYEFGSIDLLKPSPTPGN